MSHWNDLTEEQKKEVGKKLSESLGIPLMAIPDIELNLEE